MNMYSKEVHKRVTAEASKRQRNLLRLKHTMANVLLLRIREEQDQNPEVDTFSTPILRPLRPVELHLLRHTPEEISRNINIGKEVLLRFDETTQPPTLHISLQDRPAND